MPDQNIGNIGLEEALNLFFASKRFREYKEEEVQVMLWSLHSSWSCFCVLPKEKIRYYRFRRAKN
jgi:hypothetical protein